MLYTFSDLEYITYQRRVSVSVFVCVLVLYAGNTRRYFNIFCLVITKCHWI